jgi:long-chain acyl-CoA synthetase
MSPVRPFWTTAADEPERPAVIVDGQVTTYGELATLAHRIANGLRDHGLKAGDTVAVLMSNRVEFLAVELATQQIGLVLAPVNRHLTAPEVAYILHDCGASVLIADSAVGDVAVPAADKAGLPAADRYAVGPVEGFRDFGGLLGRAAIPADRTAGVTMLYSSGTTGRPKGIERPLSGLDPVAALDTFAQGGLRFGVTPRGVFLSVGPLYHSAPNNHTLLALQLAQTVVLGSGFDAVKILGLLERYRVTDAFLVPTMMHRLLRLPDAVRRGYDLSALRLVMHAGAICPVHTKRAMVDWLGPILLEYYGASESSSVAQINSHDWLQHPGSVGQPNASGGVRIFDEEGTELPPGVPGLIHVRSTRPFVYRSDPEKTRRSHRDGYFIPGDIGYLDAEGWLYICDRRTDMIISGGVNIYPAEIEAVLLEHKSVADAAVIGLPDPEWGQKVLGIVELRGDQGDEELVVESILASCRTQLARFKIPARLDVVAQLPRTPAGKINRGALRDAYVSADD